MNGGTQYVHVQVCAHEAMNGLMNGKTQYVHVHVCAHDAMINGGMNGGTQYVHVCAHDVVIMNANGAKIWLANKIPLNLLVRKLLNI